MPEPSWNVSDSVFSVQRIKFANIECRVMPRHNFEFQQSRGELIRVTVDTLDTVGLVEALRADSWDHTGQVCCHPKLQLLLVPETWYNFALNAGIYFDTYGCVGHMKTCKDFTFKKSRVVCIEPMLCVSRNKIQ